MKTKGMKYELCVLLNQNTRIELSVAYKISCPNHEKSFSEFVEDIIINGLTKKDNDPKKNEDGLMIICNE